MEKGHFVIHPPPVWQELKPSTLVEVSQDWGGERTLPSRSSLSGGHLLRSVSVTT